MDEITYTAVATGFNVRGDVECIVTDTDGNEAVLSLRKDGAIVDGSNMPIGTNADPDYVALRALLQAAKSQLVT